MYSDKVTKSVAEAASKIMMGEKALHPNQQKLDVHEPEKDKLTADDFKKLRAKKEEVEQEETILEYESKDGVYKHQARPGRYGGSEKESDYVKGPSNAALKKIEAEKKKPKKFSEMLDVYQNGGIKGLFEQLAVVEEEASQDEFNKEIKDAQDKSEGKKKAEVAKAAVQAVQNEETHTTVEVVDLNGVNGVQHSEIDLAEKTLTEPETKKKEEVVMSMKKGLQGFKDRYGNNAKSVMYATATKIAKDKA
jgi:hypothetical protein